jgi:Ran GTPase-activating protein (RanGAP) involved in mRNA processing and transport
VHSLNVDVNDCVQLRDEGVKAIAEGLKANRGLSIVDLQSNEIGPQGAAYLAEFLKENTPLQEVSLSCCYSYYHLCAAIVFIHCHCYTVIIITV